jgi:ribosome recycling factor
MHTQKSWPGGQETYKNSAEEKKGKGKKEVENWKNNLNNIRNGREHKKVFYRFKREVGPEKA